MRTAYKGKCSIWGGYAISSSNACADYVNQVVATTCAPNVGYFSFQSFTLTDLPAQNDVMSGPIGESRIMDLGTWVTNPIQCTLQGYEKHTIKPIGTSYPANSTGRCLDGGPPPLLAIMLDGKLILKDAIFSLCGNRVTSIEFTPGAISYCSMPDINQDPIEHGDQSYQAGSFADSKPSNVAADCRVLDIYAADLKAMHPK